MNDKLHVFLVIIFAFAGYLLSVNTAGWQEAFFVSLLVNILAIAGLVSKGNEDSLSGCIANIILWSIIGLLIGELITFFGSFEVSEDKLINLIVPK